MRFALAAMKTFLPLLEDATRRLTQGAALEAPQGEWLREIEQRLESAEGTAGQGGGALAGQRLAGLCIHLRANGPTRRYLVGLEGLLAAAAGHPSDILLAGETSLEVRQLLAAPSLALAQHLARAARPSSISRSSGPASGGDGPAAGALTSTPEEGPSDREASPGWVADLPSVVAAVAQVRGDTLATNTFVANRERDATRQAHAARLLAPLLAAASTASPPPGELPLLRSLAQAPLLLLCQARAFCRVTSSSPNGSNAGSEAGPSSRPEAGPSAPEAGPSVPGGREARGGGEECRVVLLGGFQTLLLLVSDPAPNRSRWGAGNTAPRILAAVGLADVAGLERLAPLAPLASEAEEDDTLLPGSLPPRGQREGSAGAAGGASRRGGAEEGAGALRVLLRIKRGRGGAADTNTFLHLESLEEAPLQGLASHSGSQPAAWSGPSEGGGVAGETGGHFPAKLTGLSLVKGGAGGLERVVAAVEVWLAGGDPSDGAEGE
ncbi:hypothetical protein T484DRAFT_1976328 [Baffinella frigidus]|nr:hypothetical protein T484DRAFT_1976328 [Cryptophyta sp. CCMP2293]